MGSFVLVIVFTCFEVPIHSCFILLQQFMIDSNIIIAGSIFRCNFRAFHIPKNSLPIHLLCSTVTNTDLICRSNVLRELACNHFQFLDLYVDIFLVTGKNEMRIYVLRVNCRDYPVGHFYGFWLLYSAVFVSHCNSHISINERWPFFDNFVVCLDSLFVSSSIV